MLWVSGYGSGLRPSQGGVLVLVRAVFGLMRLARLTKSICLVSSAIQYESLRLIGNIGPIDIYLLSHSLRMHESSAISIRKVFRV